LLSPYQSVQHSEHHFPDDSKTIKWAFDMPRNGPSELAVTP